MSYHELVSSFLNGLFRAGLSIELLIVKASRDAFRHATAGLDQLWVSGKKQLEALD